MRGRLFALALVAAGCEGAGGGTIDGGSMTDAMDPTFQWSMRTPLSIPRVDVGVAAVGGKMYVMGGASGSTLARVDAYDPISDTWEQKADMHYARRQFAVGVIDGKIYVTGGKTYTDLNQAQFLTETESYDPTTDTWTDHASCPTGPPPQNGTYSNISTSGAVVNGRFYLAVFNAWYVTQTLMYVYDPTADTWTNLPNAGFEADDVAAVAVDGIVYVMSGGTHYVGTALTSYNPSADLWIIRPPLPDVVLAAHVASGGKVYSLGGIKPNAGPIDLVSEYDPMARQWSARGHLIVARAYAGAGEWNGTICLFGGASQYSGPMPVPSDLVECGVVR